MRQTREIGPGLMEANGQWTIGSLVLEMVDLVRAVLMLRQIIGGKILAWIHDFLKNRVQTVKIDSHESEVAIYQQPL